MKRAPHSSASFIACDVMASISCEHGHSAGGPRVRQGTRATLRSGACKRPRHAGAPPPAASLPHPTRHTTAIRTPHHLRANIFQIPDVDVAILGDRQNPRHDWVLARAHAMCQLAHRFLCAHKSLQDTRKPTAQGARRGRRGGGGTRAMAVTARALLAIWHTRLPHTPRPSGCRPRHALQATHRCR